MQIPPRYNSIMIRNSVEDVIKELPKKIAGNSNGARAKSRLDV